MGQQRPSKVLPGPAAAMALVSSVPARVWWGEEAPSVWCKYTVNFAFPLPFSRSLSTRGYCRTETLRQGPLSDEGHILNHLQGSCPTVVSPGLFSDAIFIPSASPAGVTTGCSRRPGGRGQAQSTHLRRPLSLPLLSVFSFRPTCPRPFCARETVPASSRREHGVSLPPFSEDPLESLHMLSGRGGGSRLLSSHRKTIFRFIFGK